MVGNPVHFEIPFDDTAKGREFWGGLFGWKFGDPYPGPGEYFPAQITDKVGIAVTNMEPGKRGMLGGGQDNHSAGAIRSLPPPGIS